MAYPFTRRPQNPALQKSTGIDYRNLANESGLRLHSVTYPWSLGTMNHGDPAPFGGATPGRIAKPLALPAPVAGTPRRITLDRNRLLVPMPICMGLTTNTTAGVRSCSARIHGVDQFGRGATEVLTIAAAPASVNTLSLAITHAFGDQVFQSVTAIDVLTMVNAAGAVAGPPPEVADTLKFGPSFYYNPKFGFPAYVEREEDVLAAMLTSNSVLTLSSRAIDLLEGFGLGNPQHGRIDIGHQYLEIVDQPGSGIIQGMANGAAAASVSLYMLVRSSQGAHATTPRVAYASLKGGN